MQDDLKKVKKRLTFVFVNAIIATCILFGAIYYLGIDMLDYYFGASHYLYNQELPYIEEFQKYVSDNDINTTDVQEYDEWMYEHEVSFYSIEREGKIIYSKSNVDTFISQAKDMYDYRLTTSYQVPVKFNDMEAEVFIYASFTEKFYITLIICDGIFSVFVGIILVFIRVKNIIKSYQYELETAQMQEKKAREEKDELMRNMAHDLRTPLTGLMTYIDIMRLENQLDKQNLEYLDTLTAKVMDIKNQMDNLLDFSMASSEKNVKLDDSMDVEYTIGDYLSEMYSILQDSGFDINIDEIEWRSIKVAVNISLLSRVFANLTANICKYADKSQVVVMRVVYSSDCFEVQLINGICKEKTLLESAGIGLKSVDMMMSRMNGSMNYSKENGMFSVRLVFPICHQIS